MKAFILWIKGRHLHFITHSHLHTDQNTLIHTAGEHFIQSLDLRIFLCQLSQSCVEIGRKIAVQNAT